AGSPSGDRPGHGDRHARDNGSVGCRRQFDGPRRDVGEHPDHHVQSAGAMSGADSKWVTTISRYARAAAIVTVQEARPAAPSSATTLPNIGPVQYHLWNLGTSTRQNLRNVYFLETDPNGRDRKSTRLNSSHLGIS